ncbi:hypothetical protein ACIQTW_19620 [Paenarthrobacter sp. NPDC090517]|uniref:hypothetical protein n=1 Tax=Paenarthrobacter sp. NPDC090517 TaxID=3364381 RepID=UPI003827A1AA
MGDIHFVGVNRGTDSLVVSFHGAVSRTETPLKPRYGYHSELRHRAESYLAKSDPTLNLDNRVTLGWYIGTDERDVHSEVAELVKRQAATMGASRIVFVGSSGGGFSAMAVAAKVPGSAVVAFSPSLEINRVTPAHTANFMAAAFPSCGSYEELRARYTTRVSMDAAYATHPDVHLFLVQNSGDESRMNGSYKPFIRDHAGHGCYRFALERHGDGHMAPPADRFHYWLDQAVSVAEVLQMDSDIWRRRLQRQISA